MDALISKPYDYLFVFLRFAGSVPSVSASGGTKGVAYTAFAHTPMQYYQSIPEYSMLINYDPNYDSRSLIPYSPKPYIAVGFRGFYGGSGPLAVRELELLHPFAARSSTNMIVVRNVASSAQSNKTALVDVAYMRLGDDAVIKRYRYKNGQPEPLPTA